MQLIEIEIKARMIITDNRPVSEHIRKALQHIAVSNYHIRNANILANNNLIESRN